MKRIALCLFAATLLWSCESKTEGKVEEKIDTVETAIIQEVEESAQDLKEEVQETKEEIDSLLNDI